jgi:ribosomal protein S18 acetylase RimI-like enzyme
MADGPRVLRPARRDEIDLLVRFAGGLYAEDGSIPLRADRASRAFERLIDDDSLGFVWLIESGATAVGYLVLTWGFSIEFGGFVAILDELFVVPEHRGGGLGTAALSAAETICRERGVLALRLEVEHSNRRALELYTRAGFTKHSRHLMTKRLA